MNNTAILNQYTPDEPASGKKLADLVFRNRVPDGTFERVRQPNLPFYCVKAGEEMQALDQLSREYRKSLRKPSQKSKTPKRQNEDSLEDTAEKASESEDEGRYPEEPQSGYIDYTKIFSKLQEQKAQALKGSAAAQAN